MYETQLKEGCFKLFSVHLEQTCFPVTQRLIRHGGSVLSFTTKEKVTTPCLIKFFSSVRTSNRHKPQKRQSPQIFTTAERRPVYHCPALLNQNTYLTFRHFSLNQIQRPYSLHAFLHHSKNLRICCDSEQVFIVVYTSNHTELQINFCY